MMGRRKKSKEELEELTRTQVLNLQELERAANYEKKTSKKPAFVFALLGVFSISLGLSYPSITNMLNSRGEEDRPVVSESREQEVEEDITTVNPLTLTCNITQANPEDANLVNTTTYTFQFLETGTLGNYQKVMDIKVNTPVTQTPASIVTLDSSLSNLMQTPITGYVLEKIPSASTTPNVVDGYQAKLNVDLTQLDVTLLTPLHTSNSFANVEFSSADTRDGINQRMIASGYQCQ